jgi:hypothetical protein
MWIVPILILGMTLAGQGTVAAESGMQVLTRGPVHEAFAETYLTGPAAGTVVRRAPYSPITELPPDYRPVGDNVAWIPGYWSWDDDRTDYIWVSGVWRDLPPGRQWIPGYWTTTNRGSQWVSGFWGDIARTEVEYLPAPPRPLEAGPSSPAPSRNSVWAPGSWVWQNTRYDWQPGYWVVQQPDWVWSPAHYTWTPRGHVYVPGFWDHDIVNRGMMFAPVYYEQPVYRRPDYTYSPSIVIDLGVILTSLFVRPRTNSYYYGDYYDRRYEHQGFLPWYSKQARQYGDDPIFMQYRSSQLQQYPDWDLRMNQLFRHRRENVSARPPSTMNMQVNIINNRQADAPAGLVIGRSLEEAARGETQSSRFRRVEMDERRQIQTHGGDVRKVQTERARIEVKPKTPRKIWGGREPVQPARVQLPPSPVRSGPIVEVERVKKLPPMPDAPQPQAVEGRGRPTRSRKGEPARVASPPGVGRGRVR